MKAFAGTQPGNETAFNLWLKPQTSESFKVNVWLDGPWDNKVWKGTKIGEIELPKTPVRSTDTNGIVGYDLYRAKVASAAGEVTASSDHPDVQVAVVQVNKSAGTAVVAFDFNGLVKTYEIEFVTE